MKYLIPKRIIVSSNNIENLNSLLVKKTLQIGYHESDLAIFKGKNYAILDFGKEISGGVRILTHSANNNAKVRLRFGESVSEANCEIGEKGATNDHSTRDFVVDIQSWSDMTFGETGFRFLRIDSLNDNDNIAIKSIVAKYDMDARKQAGKFVCDDKIINKIWKTASYTLRLCLKNNYLWDGIKRDRLVWIGDLYPEMKAGEYLYNRFPEPLNSLEFACAETPLPLWVADMPAYSLWWLIDLFEHFKNTGDKNIILKYCNYIEGLVQQIFPYVKDDGETCYPFNFIDWQSQPKDENNKQVFYENLAGMAYLTKIAMKKTSILLENIGKNSDLCHNIIEKLNKKQWNVKLFRQVSALGILADSDLENNKKTLLTGGTKGISTFMAYIIFKAMCKVGSFDEAFSIMKEYYNGMLSVGATTFFEDFNLEWVEESGRIDEITPYWKKDFHGDHGDFCYKGFRHSLCHGWSAGVIAYIVENVMGINFVGIGKRKIVVKPHLSTIKNAEITIPTPFGNVFVKHMLNSENKVVTTVNAPEEIEIIVEE